MVGVDRAHVWGMLSNPVWLENKLVLEYWISNVSLCSRDSAVLLKLLNEVTGWKLYFKCVRV